MHSARCRSIFQKVLKFLQIKEGGLISGWNQFCRKSELFGPPFCISILKVLWTQILCHSIDCKHSTWFSSTFLRVFKFLQIKEGESNFWVEPILQKVWVIWSSLLYFNFKSFLDPNSLLLIRFQCIVHDSGVLLSESWNFYKLKRGNLVSGLNQFCRKSELFCVSILNVF